MQFSSFDHECMTQALRLAEQGLNTSHPNPRVGCVITQSERVVGTGWHRAAGEDHAEIGALKDAGSDARGATVYVTLEPCAHTGRTGACTEALIEAGVGRVVAAVTDPFHEVSGKGINRLRAEGIQVDTGLMQQQALALNAGFFSRIQRGRPWVRVKSAQSMDGRTALSNGESKWITSEASRADVQNWRARSDAILTGIGTVLADDPRMTVRSGDVIRQPLRVVLDSQFRISNSAQILNPPDRALVIGCHAGTAMNQLGTNGVECIVAPADPVSSGVDLKCALEVLGEREINEVQVEAGGQLCGALLAAGLVDEILLYQAPVLLGVDAAPAFSIGPLETMAQGVHLEVLDTTRIGPDTRYRLAPRQED